jgi:Leucine-rich repeat (LRR) protein
MADTRTTDDQAINDLLALGGCVDTPERIPGCTGVGVNFDRSRVTDAVFVPLSKLSRLHYLKLSQTSVTDKVMDVLRIHPEIRRLDISDTLITDKGMKCLKHGASLEELYLGNGITDTGFQHVMHLKKLRLLALEVTKVTDKGLRSIVTLANLECLFLSTKQITTTSAGWLGELPKLKTINLLGDGNSAAEPVVAQLKKLLPMVGIEW